MSSFHLKLVEALENILIDHWIILILALNICQLQGENLLLQGVNLTNLGF